MKIDRVVSLFFSPNGTTRQVADAIAQGVGAPERLDLDRTPFDSRWAGEPLRPGDLAVIALPVYYGRLPKLMVEFFRYIKAEGIPAVLAVTYGNRDHDDALLELKNESLDHGFIPVAAGAFVAHHCMAGKLAQGRPGPARTIWRRPGIWAQRRPPCLPGGTALTAWTWQSRAISRTPRAPTCLWGPERTFPNALTAACARKTAPSRPSILWIPLRSTAGAVFSAPAASTTAPPGPRPSPCRPCWRS